MIEDQEKRIHEIAELYRGISLLEFNEIKNMFKEEYKQIESAMIKRMWRDFVYSLSMADYKKDRIWEFLNDDIEREYFDHFVEGVHKGWFK